MALSNKSAAKQRARARAHAIYSLSSAASGAEKRRFRVAITDGIIIEIRRPAEGLIRGAECRRAGN